MTRLHLLTLYTRNFRVPRSRVMVQHTKFSSAIIKTNLWLHKAPQIVTKPANVTVPKLAKGPQGLRELKFEESQAIFGELVELINEKCYSKIVPILSSHKNKRRVLSNPHLLSLISLLLELNLKGIAYEIYLLYNSEIESDIKGYPSELLEMLLNVVYYYQDNTNFDILLSQYLNSRNLNEEILKKALKFYINCSSIELAKQLFYQVITFYSQNNFDASPEILEVFLSHLIANGSNFNNVEFGFNVWAQQGLPVTFTINDLMLSALIKSGQTNKLNNFIVKLAKEDPLVLEFNDFLKKLNQIAIPEFKSEFNRLRFKYKGDKNYFYIRVVSVVEDVSVLLDYILPGIVEDCNHSPVLLLHVADRVAVRSNVETLANFLETTVIPYGSFNYRFLRLFCGAYISNYPDVGSKVNQLFQKILHESFDSKVVSWVPKLTNLSHLKYKDDFKLIKNNRRKLMEMLFRIDKLDIPIDEKLGIYENNLSRLGLQSNELLYKYLISTYRKPSFTNSKEVKLMEELMLNSAPEEDIVKTELAIVKKNVELLFEDRNIHPVNRLQMQKEIILHFLVKRSNELDLRLLSELCDIYISIKEFSISEKILLQIKEIQSKSRGEGPFEEVNYSKILTLRLEFKQAVLSHNYSKIIELVLSFKKRDDLKLRKFFIKLLKRDLSYLEKFKGRLESLEVKTVDEIKETLVVEKLCIYLGNFIAELGDQHRKETDEVIAQFESKVLRYKDYCI